jgi:hypothetical protein
MSVVHSRRSSLCLSVALAVAPGSWNSGHVVVYPTSHATASAPPGAKPTGKQLLAKGLAQSRNAAYAASIATLEQARAAGGLSREEQLELLFCLASNHVAGGTLAAARAALVELFAIDPGFAAPPYTSPKVVSLVNEVRDSAASRAPAEREGPRLEVAEPELRRDGGVRLRFVRQEATAPTQGVVSWRLRGSTTSTELPLQLAGAELVAEIPALAGLKLGEALDLWIEAPGGFKLGSESSPLTVVVRQGVEARAAAALSAPVTSSQEELRRTKRTWLIVGVSGLGAGVALALGVGLGVGLRSGADGDSSQLRVTVGF